MGTFQRNLPEMGLMDYKARAYDSALGRFVQPDTIVPGAGNPQAYNRFSYVLNMPIIATDPSGHKACINQDENGNCVADPDSKYGSAKFRQLETHDLLSNENLIKGLDFAENYKDVIGQYSPVDCTNFVSQTWNAAGIVSTDQWQQGSDAWIGAPQFVEYWMENGVEPIKIENSPQTRLLDNPLVVNSVDNVQIPILSIIAYDDSSTEVQWDHLAIVVGYDSQGIPRIDEHNGPKHDPIINQRSMLDSENLNISRIWIFPFPGQY